MNPLFVSRRRFLVTVAALTTAGALARSKSRYLAKQIVDLEREIGGRIGLAVLDTADGHRFEHRGNERFAMCSTLKLMLAAAILSRIDSGTLRLDQPVAFTRSDRLPVSPIAEAYPDGGAVTLQRMLTSLMEASDNTAANLLLTMIGGPPGYTAYLRSIGDRTTHLDRMELDLNSNLPGDERDTTSPNAMLDAMNRVLLGNQLSANSRERLLQGMRNCKTGYERLRARLPQGWEAGDRTGTGDRGAVNDLAIFFPPGRAPILVTCYMTGSPASTRLLNNAHAQIGALVASIASNHTENASDRAAGRPGLSSTTASDTISLFS